MRKIDVKKMMAEIAKPSELGKLLDKMMRERGLKGTDLTGQSGLPTEVLLA